MSQSTLATNAQKPIYLIVATAVSPALGIGNKGNLPWSQIRTDMAFFRKVTSDAGNTSNQGNTSSPHEQSSGRQNAVIMGRKTWESIPERFRPLAGRVNVVLTRGNVAACRSLAERVKAELEKKAAGKSTGTKADSATTVPESDGWTLATRRARESDDDDRDNRPAQIHDDDDNDDGRDVLVHIRPNSSQTIGDVIVTNSLSGATDLANYTSKEEVTQDDKGQIRELFCIGGAEIYGKILRDDRLRRRVRVLQTLVKRLDDDSFECDTFWPEQNMEDGLDGWRLASDDEVRSWTGTDLPQDLSAQGDWVADEKAGVELKVLGWTRT